MNRIDRLKKMQAELRRGLAAKGQERIQRSVLESIILESFHAGEPVLEWLVAQIGQMEAPQKDQVMVFENEDHLCPGCGRNFTNRVALNGHGPGRCLAKQKKK